MAGAGQVGARGVLQRPGFFLCAARQNHGALSAVNGSSFRPNGQVLKARQRLGAAGKQVARRAVAIKI